MPLPRWILSAALVGALLATPGTASAAGRDLFSDDDGTPYERAIEALAANDIVTGCAKDGNAYCPTNPIRRDQAATLLARAFQVPATGRDYFDDDNRNTHEGAINRLAAAGISRGCGEERDYCVSQRLRRNQMATLLVRASAAKKTSRSFFRDTGSSHARAANRLAAAGITEGCSTRPARFCPYENLSRGEMAVFLARALDLRPRTQLTPMREARVEAKAARTRASRKAAPGRTSATTVWDRLAGCESGGNWSINTGNGYYGGLQFSLSSWRAVGGSGYPHKASRAEQIRRARKLRAGQGWGAWPACSGKLGLP
jgi:hypothetical protein